MQLIKTLIILSIIVTFNYAKTLKPIVFEKTVFNANTILIELEGNNISDVKLSLKDFHIPFYKNKFKKNSFYALVPISYYEKIGKKRVIISYLENSKRVFTSTIFEVKDGNYKSEKIFVQNSKVNLNKKDKERSKKEYAQAMRIYKSKTKNIAWEKDFIMPMNSKITSEFGTKRVYNNQLKSFHSGIDFKAKVGTEIYAANDGVVKLVQDRFYAGNSIVIDHGQGVFTCYFHLSKMNVKIGQKVKRGELIALSGDTGRITGPHLHFATRVHGVLVEPIALFKILNSLNGE